MDNKFLTGNPGLDGWLRGQFIAQEQEKQQALNLQQILANEKTQRTMDYDVDAARLKNLETESSIRSKDATTAGQEIKNKSDQIDFENKQELNPGTLNLAKQKQVVESAMNKFQTNLIHYEAIDQLLSQGDKTGAAAYALQNGLPGDKALNPAFIKQGKVKLTEALLQSKAHLEEIDKENVRGAWKLKEVQAKEATQRSQQEDVRKTAQFQLMNQAQNRAKQIQTEIANQIKEEQGNIELILETIKRSGKTQKEKDTESNTIKQQFEVRRRALQNKLRQAESEASWYETQLQNEYGIKSPPKLSSEESLPPMPGNTTSKTIEWIRDPATGQLRQK